MARFEFVELLDRHHVHRSKPIDLRAQLRDRFFGAQSTLRVIRGITRVRRVDFIVRFFSTDDA